MQPGIPDTAYVYAAGLTLLLGALMACAGVAWPKLRLRWLDKAIGIGQQDRPGDILTTPLATGLLHAAQREAFDDLARHNPDLANVDADALAEFYLVPEEGPA